MDNINITINGQLIGVKPGDSLLSAAARNGIVIPSLCWHKSVSVYGACGLCLVEAENSPKLLRACATAPAEGMVINTETPRVVRARKAALEFIMSDHNGDCIAPCRLSCPSHTDCQAYVKQTALGNYTEAVRIIKDNLPLPASIGRVCPKPCEEACRRQNVESPISIAFLKYFAADMDLASPAPWKPKIAESSGKTVGIIGGGPAGLSAAYFLAVKGHKVTVYDAMPKMGGMLRYGIPEYRLPKSVLGKEIALIADLGVSMKNGVRIGEDISLEELRPAHDALLVAIGAWSGIKINCTGEDSEGVISGIEFLKDIACGVKPVIGDSVVIIGGGNTAMDACRTAVRLGANKVCVAYRRTRAEMPAEDIEIEEAQEEGVSFKFLVSPAEIIAKDGRVSAVKLQLMELGEPDESGRRSPVPTDNFETIEADTVIAALGQRAVPKGFEILKLNKRGFIEADEAAFTTSQEGIFAAGDATNKGAGIAIAAIGEARKASLAIDSFLKGKLTGWKMPFISERTVTEKDFADVEKRQRADMPKLSPEERRTGFREVNKGFSEETAKTEAARCLECGCHAYDDCRLIKCARLYDINPERIAGEKSAFGTEQKLLCIERNQDKCILCGLCVRTCYEKAGKGIIDIQGRGSKSVIRPEFQSEETIEYCRDCLKCAEVCPTGALRVIIKPN